MTAPFAPTFAFALALTLGGCASAPAPAASNASPSSAAPATKPSVDAIALPEGSDPNGLFWNDATHTLVMADDDGNRLFVWNDGTGWFVLAPLPPSAAARPGMGQPVQLADGTVVVPRFGGGTDGDVAVVRPDGTSSVVPNLDKARRRIGLTLAADGQLYDSYFVKTDTGRVGGVSHLDLSKGETEIASSLKKPVGVLGIGSALFIADQDAKTLLELALPAQAASTPPTTFASLPGADLLSKGPNDSIFTGGGDGAVHQIDARGHVTVFASGFGDVRGIAYDPSGRRLFFVDHASPKSGKKSALLIRPVP